MWNIPKCVYKKIIQFRWFVSQRSSLQFDCYKWTLSYFPFFRWNKKVGLWHQHVMCVLRQVYQALYRPCFLGMTGCGCLYVWSVFVLLKQLTDTDSLNLDMNITIQLDDTPLPYMQIYYNPISLLRNKRKTDISCKLCSRCMHFMQKYMKIMYKHGFL